MQSNTSSAAQLPTHWWEDGRTLALLSATGFSLKAIFIKLAYAHGHIDAVTLLALRMGLALPAFILLACYTKGDSFRPADWGRMLMLGFLGYYLSSLFDFIGLQYISAGLERLILFTYPTFVLLMEAAWRRKWPKQQVWIGIALSYAGLIAAFGHDAMHTAATSAVLLGGGWIFLSSLTYSGYYLGTGRYVKQYGSTRLAGYSGAMACGLVLSHYALTKPLLTITQAPSGVYLWAFCIAIFSTVLPIWLAARAVERMGPGKAAAMGTIGPALTIALGWIILKEPFSWLQLLGLALVLAGVHWIGKSK